MAPPDSDDFDRLSGTAAAVWRLLEEPRTVAELVGTLGARYGSPPAEIERDARALLQELVCRGHVEEVPENACMKPGQWRT